MRRLMLLRHAKTEADAPSGRDFDRRLDPRGRDDAALVGRWLAKQARRPERVLVSTAIRARQTWDIVEAELAAAGIGAKPVHLKQLYGAGPAQLIETVQVEAGDAATVMVIAHNPGLHELAFCLAGKGDADARAAIADNLPTGAVATLDFDDNWSGVRFRAGDLVGFVSPKLLKA